MSFGSILFRDGDDHGGDDAAVPACLGDLNLDQVIAAVIRGREAYDLTSLFHRPLRDVDDIAFRHEVMRDLERPGLLEPIEAFSLAMRGMRERLARADELSQPRQKQRWHLDAVDLYCEAVGRLGRELAAAEPASRGLTALSDHLSGYVGTAGFAALRDQAKALLEGLQAVHYSIQVKGLQVAVRRYDGEPDYSAEVAATFERFRQGTVEGPAFKRLDMPEMNRVEALILDQVARLYEELFCELEGFAARHREFVDPALLRFDREVQVYLAYLDHIRRLKAVGLSFCYPDVRRGSKDVQAEQAFDLALAAKLIDSGATPVRNDIRLEGRERIIVVSGPNQGGKTTFARTFGQLHYLARLGLPVPGTRARLVLCDRIFTHFEREEAGEDLQGKLQDDLVRLHDILAQATPDSIVIMNEIFTSTTWRDALALSRRVAAQLLELDLLCVWVSFVDELAALGDQVVSMVSLVAPDDPARRTYRIVRRPADGLAHVMAIAERYGLTRERIRERIGR